MTGRIMPIVVYNFENEMYGNIEINWARRYNRQLGFQWTLVDPRGNEHQVRYNKSLTIPMLTVGWREMRFFYGLINGDYCVQLTHVGNDAFNITVKDFPSFTEIEYLPFVPAAPEVVVISSDSEDYDILL